jgi:uncharacterized membrane protein
MDAAHIRLVEVALLVVHVLGGGVWIGAMVFSIFILHPRAETFFARAVDFEHFIFHVVHGARWKVAAGIAAIAASGVGLSRWPGHSVLDAGGYRALVAAKLLCFCVSAVSFIYVSWVLWPRRAFATREELPALKSRFWRIGVVMIVANAANMTLGIAAHVWRA